MSKKGCRIGKIKKTHQYLKDNQFIIHGYRKNFQSTKAIFLSLFTYHNETINVWTHLAGLGLFFLLVCYCVFTLGFCTDLSEAQIMKSLVFGFQKVGDYSHELQDDLLTVYHTLKQQQFNNLFSKFGQFENQIEEELVKIYNDIILKDLQHLPEQSRSQAALQLVLQFIRKYLPAIDENNLLRQNPNEHLQRWPIFVFLACAMICFSFSSIFHLFSAHTSYIIRYVFNRLDYAGISILIAGSFYPPIYYYYYCFPHLIWIYLGGITSSSLVAFVLAMTPNFAKASHRTFRGIIFLTLGLLGVVPFLHMFFLQGLYSVEMKFFLGSLVWYLLMGFSYVIGVLIYISRLPERYFPEKFDLLGNSHNIWHCFVIFGAMFHYLGVMNSFHTRQHLSCY